MSDKTILLIEPEASLRAVLEISLSELGDWHVNVSSSIQQGIEQCKITQPDVILLDTSTPEIDALIFVEQLKYHSMARSIPILLITARADWFTSHQLQAMGFAGAIAKPFNPATLSAQIVHLLEANREERS
ncbi:response regulator [Leptolyngbya sp. NIES-2104]|uniref:response regulator n=1 Tax=Leptolyngbya sp. NIES-2104 TaxID=1552121 RepID=UPI0006ECC0D1|nr:response regulator [Leptolyngbya sp. NIES-2104]GAP98984.1 two-component response regulator [Leptolyngbya sp. NIES-2104]